MRIEIELEGRRRTMEVRQEAGGWVVALDGRELSANLAEAGGRWSLLLTQDGAAPRSYDVAVDANGAGDRLVHVNGQAVPVEVVDPRRARRARGGDAAAAGGAVVAPMSGRVVKVLVEPGQRVAARQGLVVVEAMKMENELRAPRAATVAEVRAQEGGTVDANAVLVMLTFDE